MLPPARVDAQNASGRPYSEPRAACAHHDPLRQVFFGELHIHTGFSLDAYAAGVRGRPDDAYRFARGQRLGLAPYAEDGTPLRHAQLARPLDFAAVTDHAVWLGAVSLCRAPDSPVFGSERCSNRDWFGICSEDNARCISQRATVWREIQEAAERHYDRSAACRFTTFNGWEYGPSKGHRNVIFRNAVVTALPISRDDVPGPAELWRRLNSECLDAGNGCDVLAIPHNANLSRGNMFGIAYRALPPAGQRARARLRRDLEPLVEIMQIKGESECRSGMFGVAGTPDEFCDFEKIRVLGRAGLDLPPLEDCGESVGPKRAPARGGGCQSRLDFVRYALIEGLREADRIGVNPYRLGVIGSTDSHNANAGDASEDDFKGTSGNADASPLVRLGAGSRGHPGFARNPGGLAGVWSEENSRDSIFDAMKRRETFATSGTRLTARFFGGWNYDAAFCENPQLVEQGYAKGVPMGGALPPAPQTGGADAAPTFVISALRDPGTAEQPGGLLQRAQIVKGWVGGDGRFQQRVVDVAGGANGADVDLGSCAPRGAGHSELCGVWRDPDFDPQQRAVYYARVLENPSCRWSTWQCNALPESERPASCGDAKLPKTIQERLWTSPIWFNPPAGQAER